MENKRLTTQGTTLTHSALILLTLTAIGIGIYLTSHFYQTFFPTKLGGASSLCDLSSFWNCDSATYSPISNIAGVPIALLGLVLNIFYLFGSIFPSDEYEQTSKTLSLINVIGCLVLFVYSLAVLGSLCPMCTVYYLLSIGTFYLFYKHSDMPFGFAVKPAGIFAVLMIGTFIFGTQYYSGKQTKQLALNKSIIEQFKKLPDLGAPNFVSPYWLLKSTDKFTDAPIQISMFSDFQCPFCKVVADDFHKIMRRYKGKMNVSYQFYPLDNTCNENVKSSFHPFACKAAQTSACNPEHFIAIHDKIFANQKNLTKDFFTDIEKEYSLQNCDNDQIKETIRKTIANGSQYNIKSTPTMIVNGKKIEGRIPGTSLQAIFDAILNKSL